jgi:tetratricopeptide (TPR) repeat protein
MITMKKITNNMFIRLGSFVLLLWVTFACGDDFFNQQAGNRINPDDHYKSITDLGVSLDGVIVPLQEVLPNLIMVDGLRSDLMDLTPNSTGDIQELYNHNYNAGNPLLSINGFYKVIINANEVLSNLSRVTEADPNFDEFYQKQVRASLIGIRAWAYFQIIKLTNEAAYIPDNVIEFNPGSPFNYVSRDAMIDTLINQLTPVIHRDESTVEISIGYYPNNRALLGELYLEQNNFDSTIVYLKSAMESYGNDTKIFKVDKTYSKEDWASIFISGESAFLENIGVVPYKADELQPNPLAAWMLPIDQYLVKPSALVYNLYNSQMQVKDVPTDQYRGIGVTIDTLANASETYIKKYSLLNDIIAGYSQDIIFMRAADIHLKLAEALNRSGDYATALILLNNGFSGEKKKPAPYIKWASNYGIRGRALLLPRTVPVEITDPGQIMEMVEDFIIEERAMELAFEGSRMFDLIRIAQRRGTPEYLADRVAAKYPAEKQGEVRNFLMNKANWYLPYSK